MNTSPFAGQQRMTMSLWPGVILSLLVAVAAIPLLVRGPSCGHDFDFHLQSWFAVRAVWHSGILVPHWVPGANYGAGEPRFVFYPPLSWLLGALLGLLLPWQLVPGVLTAVCLGGAALAMYRVSRRFLAHGPAVLAAGLYALSPYLLFGVYERSAYGEVLAAGWIALLLGAVLEPQLPVLRAALLLAALWYTNAPAAVMGCYFLLFFVLARALRRSRKDFLRSVFRDLLRAALALLLGCGLAADYLLPAWYEQRFVAISRAVGPGMRVEDSFLFGHTGEPFHDAVLRSASWLAVLTLGAGLLAGSALLLRRSGLVAAERGSQRECVTNSTEPRLVLLLTLLLLSVLLLTLPFSARLWHLLPELAFLQFPWRLLLPASAAAALLLACALSPALMGKKSLQLFVFGGAALSLLLVNSWAGRTLYRPCDDEDNIAAQQQLLQPSPPGDAPGFEGTDEYAAADSDNGAIQQGLPAVRLLPAPDSDEGDDTNAANPPWQHEKAVPGVVSINRWQPEILRVQVRPAAPAYAVLRLERFPAWRVLLNGQPCGRACVPREDGLVTIRLPGGRLSTIDASYGLTGDVMLGRVASALTLALSLALMAAFPMGRTRRRAQLL